MSKTERPFILFANASYILIQRYISRRDDTKTGVIYHNTIISRFSKPIDCVSCISHAQRLDLPHLLLRISSGISVEMNWACFECSSPARLFHLWGWLVPISRHIPNLKHIKIIWNKPLQLKILLKSARFAYNDRTPPVGKAGGGDRWPSNRSQFGYWTCKINLWVDSVELNRCYTMNGKILEKIKCIMEGDIPPNADAPVRVSHTH